MVVHLSKIDLGRPWLKPIGRALLAIVLGIFGQLIPAFGIWAAIGRPDQFTPIEELIIKMCLIAVECSVLVLIALDKEPLGKYINLRKPGQILMLGTLGAIPLVIANRVTHGWIIRFVHGEFAYYNRLTGSNWGAGLFMLLACVYYFLEIFVLVYAYVKLAEGLNAWRILPRWVVILAGWGFLFLAWSLLHGFVFSGSLAFGIGLYLPLIFVLLYEYTGSLVAPAITWYLFLAI
jgi:hypothetical protein